MCFRFIQNPNEIRQTGLVSSSPIGDRADYRRHDYDPKFNFDSDAKHGWHQKIPRLPVSISIIILMICLIIFMMSLLNTFFVINYLALIPEFLSERPWTIITYMFVHITFDHLFWNMLFLFFFGIELERRLGEWRFLGLYLVAGVVAALAQVLLIGGGILLGASGAVYGVLGCLAMIAPHLRLLLFFVIPIRIPFVVLLYALIDFVMMGSADNIAHAAHLAGLFVGLVFGYALRRRPNQFYTF
ncbi:MAG: rhomboid family intramembrane serine protease [Methanotrichaceae archaeon]|nr:rhomboid family intramembrane serine protease [Methanotrichaceae archaeon]